MILLRSEAWSTPMIAQALRLHETTVSRYLDHFLNSQKLTPENSFNYKQPKGVPHKFDEELQSAFIEKYEALKACVPDDEPILFMDAVHPTQATKLSYGWIRTGVDKVTNTIGSRTRLNIMGAIRLGHLTQTIRAQYQTINGEGYHRSGDVKEKAESLNIVLHYLSTYSPNLNPFERLWKVMNEHARNNRYFAPPKNFDGKLTTFLSTPYPTSEIL